MKKGFTLVELAIVLTIIGLLIGGILKGQELLNNARVTSTIKAVSQLNAAYTGFRDTYSQIPGDMATATRRITGCGGLSATGNWCIDGNGNSQIGVASFDGWLSEAGTLTAPQVETSMFWKHLALAGFISGVEPSAHPVNDLAWGRTHPAAPGWSGGFHAIHWGVAWQEGNYLRWQAPVSAPTLQQPAGRYPVSPKYAAAIDRKMDDGKPRSGFIYGTGRLIDNTQICSTPGVPSNTQIGDYLETVSSANCLMFFLLGNR